MCLMRKHEIIDRLVGKPYLILVESNVTGIPERLQEYDPGLFVCWNVREQRYEIHTLNNRGDTYGFSVPFDILDARTIEKVKANDLKTRNFKDYLREIDQHNEQMQAAAESQRLDDLHQIAGEVRPYFKQVNRDLY